MHLQRWRASLLTRILGSIEWRQQCQRLCVCANENEPVFKYSRRRMVRTEFGRYGVLPLDLQLLRVHEAVDILEDEVDKHVRVEAEPRDR